MKIRFLTVFFGLVCAAHVCGQVDFPGNPMVTPKKFTTRPLGGGVNTGATVEPGKAAAEKVRYVTHIVLYESRMWTSSEGKPLDAKLIAFEDLVAEGPKGSDPVMPVPPANPTVTRNGKVRLLVDKKPVEVALDRLSEQDREFVEGIKAALAKKASAGH
ncbi:MAG: hypothetical protein ABIT37_21410 [Luteolibacter sp.]